MMLENRLQEGSKSLSLNCAASGSRGGCMWVLCCSGEGKLWVPEDGCRSAGKQHPPELQARRSALEVL